MHRFYGSKVWGSNSKYRKVIWQCNDKFKGDIKCSTPHVTEDEVKQKFVEAFNSMMEYRDELIANCRLAQKTLCDCLHIDAKIDELHIEIEVVTELSRKAIYENANAAIKQDEWNKRNNEYLERHQKATESVIELDDLKLERRNKERAMGSFIRGFKAQIAMIDQFGEKLWIVMVEKVTVIPNGQLFFRFFGGTEISK